MSVRAGIVVTGTEVLSGIVADRNGPWLSERLRERGVELAHIVVVADRPADVRAALDFLAREGVDLILTSGGLGPTADDLTAEVVGGFAGRPMVLDEALEERILAILRRNRVRWRSYSEEAMRAGNRKQAMVPEGATILEPVGTAPGLIVPSADGAGPLVVVLPGPPGELRPMWGAAVEAAPLRAVLERAGTLEQRILRLYGVPESEIALSLVAIEDAGVPLDRLEITTCLRRGEIEIATVFPPDAAPVYDAFADGVRDRHGDTLFSDDGSTVDEQVAGLLAGRTIAVAESCTGGLMAGRLTDRTGSSAYVLGGVVVYSNDAKVRFADVPAEVIERHGAVSPEVAAALADGAIARFGAELGIGITGVAGPGGGTEAKPVGMVCLSVARAGGERLDRTVQLPGDRAMVRERTTTVAMHMLRALLLRIPDAHKHPMGVQVQERAPRLRLFVALDLPAAPVSALAAFRDAAADPAVWRPLDEATFHVTLAFLGHRPEADVAAVRAVLGGLAPREPAALALGDGLLLPSRRARVLTVALEDASGALGALQAELSAGLEAAGVYTPEGRPFRPHVTVARLRAGARAPRELGVAPARVTFRAGPVVLYRSHVGRGGATYEPLATRTL